eukprot:NODE_18321_length_898_cov_11.180285.p1 GENE.NODE_18321_length_898_cov_11.180285~~NODE_18321_length_898_cov_11.180285.p1  ORF type:complete len:173 (+),score=39.53 NODE_18321_length_898_cov_11.180285:121-639(+)
MSFAACCCKESDYGDVKYELPGPENEFMPHCDEAEAILKISAPKEVPPQAEKPVMEENVAEENVVEEPEKTTPEPAAREFSVVLTRDSPTEPLGFAISGVEEKYAKITGISGHGALARWQEKHPDQMLRVGMLITQVNDISSESAADGVSSYKRMRDLCQHEESLTLTVLIV